ncbi:EAL domain-containing protein [Arvimicrobium flavum]|uniref:EAL domain-containing protein n=1 Tax=Arvimicrobium flavum TaxID=3393320 RepID=UPI00237B7321|nr:EAL domain-containing protein [Mesorhizobium shangrilense]
MSLSSLLDAVLADEVGIETGIYDGHRLKSAYQPVYAPFGDHLRIVAVDAATIAQREGIAVDLQALLASGDPIDPGFLAGLAQLLHVDNYRHVSVPDCDLVLEHDVSQNRRLFEALDEAGRQAEAMDEPVLEASRVICRVGNPAALGDDCVRLLEELRAAGFRLSVDLFDGVLEDPKQRPRFTPDIAEIDGAWLAKIAHESAAARLLKPLAAAYKREGMGVFIRGISSVEQLRLAVDAGADYLAGDFLSPPALVGTVIDEQPKPMDGVWGRPDDIVQFRA